MTKFGIVTQVGRSTLLGRQSRPLPKGAGPSVPQLFGTPMYDQTVSPTATTFGMVTRVRDCRVSRGVSHAPFQEMGSSVPQISDLLHVRTQYEKQLNFA